MSESLDAAVKTLLEQRRGNWQAIVDETKVSHSWLSKFVNGKIPNPGYGTLKLVHDCLLKQQKARVRQ